MKLYILSICISVLKFAINLVLLDESDEIDVISS